MQKPKFRKIIKKSKVWADKNSPAILTGIGIAGMFTAIGLTTTATIKAKKIVEDACGENEKLERLEVVKLTWKCFIPPAVVAITSSACLIGSNSINVRRNAALATAYKLSETALTEYREKVVETIGKSKEKTIREEITKNKLESNPVSKNEVIITARGNTLCYDVISGRYFKSDYDQIQKIENELNRRMLSEGYISLSEFYNEVGLPHTKFSSDLGWNLDMGKLELELSSRVADDGTPALVIDYRVAPKYYYWKYA